MNHFITYIFQIKNSTTSPKISFLVPVTFQNPILICYQNKTSYIKLTLLIQQWSINIFLTKSNLFTLYKYMDFHFSVFLPFTISYL